eukprot:6492021-Amphidinium_carterae.2
MIVQAKLYAQGLISGNSQKATLPIQHDRCAQHLSGDAQYFYSSRRTISLQFCPNRCEVWVLGSSLT